jgi:hypothetical protein
MRLHWKGVVATVAVGGIALGLGLAPAGGASADTTTTGYQYHPTVGTLYAPSTSELAQANKGNSVLYPKSAELPDGRLVAAFERSIGDPVGQTIPVYQSDDFGGTWQKLSDVQAPAYLSDDPAYAKYTSAWTNPYLYVLPEDVGDLKKGTLLLASVVSGDDDYYREQKAADPSWSATHDGDRQDLAIALYASTDEGQTWSIVNIIAQGGWEANYGNTFSAANTYHQQDPVWEPYLMAYDGQLVAYYSDENDYSGFDTTTGQVTLNPQNDTGTADPTGLNPNDTGGQILDHRTWNGEAGSTWSAPVVDAYGSFTAGTGFTGRPGMTNVVPTTDGKWILTAETGITKVSDSPLRFWDAPSLSFPAHTGGSPVIVTVPDPTDPTKWSLVFNDSASGNDVYVNASGRSDGTWVRYQTPIGNGYSRDLQYVPQTGRLLILRGTWGGSPITYAEADLGHSAGAYYALVNRKTGQVLGTGGKTQDANLSGDVPDVVTEAQGSASDPDTELWHLQGKTGGAVTLLNKAGGRAVGLWQGNAASGTQLTQWTDDGGTDKLWNLVSSGDGYYELQSAKGPSLYATAATAGAAVTLAAASTADPTAQQWQLVRQAPTAADVSAQPETSGLIAATTVSPGSSLHLDVSVATTPGGGLLHAGTVGEAYAFADSTGTPIDLGPAGFDANGTADVAVPATLAEGGYRIAVQFDELPLVWDAVRIGQDQAAPTPVTAQAGPTVSGAARVGSTLTASPGTWSPSTATVRYQWYRSGQAIAGATGATYTLQAADLGATIWVSVTASAPGHTSVTVTSPALAKVAPGTLTAHRPRIAGKHKVGRRVHAVSGPWTQTAVTVTYRWYRSGHLIHGATKAGYKLRAADRHRRISVKVVAKAAGYHAYKKRSAATKPIR